MTGPASPSTEGPTFAPPQLPPGWIAQWDSASKKYYYVQLATGVSQWEIPTEAAKTGSTPAQHEDHPYGVPPPEIITHPDGSQTVKHADGRMEPIMADGSRGMGDGPSGDRGFGSMAMNALLGGKQGGSSGGGSSSLGNLANQFLGGGGGGGGKTSSGIGGKLVGQLASNLFSPSDKPEAPSNYHGGQTQNASGHHQGGLAGAVMGGVASMFGGQQGSGNQNFGYSNTGTGGTYSSSSPAPTYNPPGSNHNVPRSNHGSQTTHGSASQSQSFSEKPSHQSSQYSDNSYSQHPPSYNSQSQHSSQHSYGGDHSSYSSQPSYNQSSHGGQGHSYSGSHGGQQHGSQQHGGGYNSGNQYGGGQSHYRGGGYQGQGQSYGGGRY
ncbi:hypothetical protein BB8028_0006g07670 [Beauveria bassiana]|uniref:WW domain-containing protein n=1 Tax=Beauveria bassiana TaxID=176275 RepID=A0A2S7YK25_BEABA|nr:hypothetical protein BB8028_0006g07670 [Beauveria bassiana]